MAPEKVLEFFRGLFSDNSLDWITVRQLPSGVCLLQGGRSPNIVERAANFYSDGLKVLLDEISRLTGADSKEFETRNIKFPVDADEENGPGIFVRIYTASDPLIQIFNPTLFYKPPGGANSGSPLWQSSQNLELFKENTELKKQLVDAQRELLAALEELKILRPEVIGLKFREENFTAFAAGIIVEVLELQKQPPRK